MRILCVHQGYELYGSDRMFILSLKAFRQNYPKAVIVVHLPKYGELSSFLVQYKLADDVIIQPLAVIRKSDLKRFRLTNLIVGLFSIKTIVKECNKYDIVYINSLVVLDYLFACHWVKSTTVVHVHEIVSGLMRRFFEQLLLFSKAKIIFVSIAAQRNYPKVKNGKVVLNGTSGIEYVKREFNNGLRLLMIGRINPQKGHDILIKAISKIKNKCQVKVRIVGDVFENQIGYRKSLVDLVNRNDSSNIVSIKGFMPNPSEDYSWANVVVIPSIVSESFGLVAVEAMSSGAVVVASRIGGLVEVFDHNISGIHFESGNDSQLSEFLIELYDNEEKCLFLAKEGRKLYEDKFTEGAYIDRFISVVSKFYS